MADALKIRAILVLALLARAGAAQSQQPAWFPPPQTESAQSWFVGGQQALQAARERPVNAATAKNIILFIGDGMGMSTVAAARMYEAQRRLGVSGEEHALFFERFPWVGLAKTFSVDRTTTDSAGSMSAIATGVKTRSGVISVAPDVAMGDAKATDGSRLPTILELCELLGKRTGVVSTTRLTDATAAACFAHAPSRRWESDSDTPAGFTDIALQLIEFAVGDGVDVALGGGARAFLPEAQGGARRDGRNLLQEWEARGEAWVVARSAQELTAIEPRRAGHVLGVLAPSHLAFAHDRAAAGLDEPALAALTLRALELLEGDDDGFFLMVEGARIDHAHHLGNAFRALDETVQLSDAVAAAVNFLEDRSMLEETLVIVTADHGHTLSVGGYAARGVDILGTVAPPGEAGKPSDELARDTLGRPYTILTYANGPGHGRSGDLAGVDAADPDYLQESAIPLRSETHGAEDVGVWARGPSAHLLARTMDQHELFHVMAAAIGLEGEALLERWRLVKAIIESHDKTGIGSGR